MQPLDLVKTRLQLQRVTTTNIAQSQHYNGVADCFIKMYKHEGFLSFYKGIIPPVLAETPKRSVKVIIAIALKLCPSICFLNLLRFFVIIRVILW